MRTTIRTGAVISHGVFPADVDRQLAGSTRPIPGFEAPDRVPRGALLQGLESLDRQ